MMMEKLFFRYPGMTFLGAAGWAHGARRAAAGERMDWNLELGTHQVTYFSDTSYCSIPLNNTS